MPVYEFCCDRCKKRFEYLTSIEEYRSELSCPECEGILKRIYSPFAIHGLGWNYQKSGYRPGVDNPVEEIKHDMKRLEQKATETHNLKEFREKKKALRYFERAHEGIL